MSERQRVHASPIARVELGHLPLSLRERVNHIGKANDQPEVSNLEWTRRTYPIQAGRVQYAVTKSYQCFKVGGDFHESSLLPKI